MRWMDAVQPLPVKWELQVKNGGKEVGDGQWRRNTQGTPRQSGAAIFHVEAHGGHLSLDWECAHTRFVVTLPKVATVQKVLVQASTWCA